jgi:hypothetical protein
MLRAGTDEARILDDALDGLAQVFSDPDTAHAVGPQFTCSEANRIAWVLVASRNDDAASYGWKRTRPATRMRTATAEAGSMPAGTSPGVDNPYKAYAGGRAQLLRMG